MDKFIIGIDPGIKGGIAVIDLCSEELVKYAYFNENRYCEIMKKYNGDVWLEQVHSMPKQGVKSTFNFGVNYGLIKGIAYCTNHKVIEISPQKWKRYFNLHNDKSESIKLSHKYYEVNLNIGKRKVIESDGMAEAILIARYGLDNTN